MYELKKNLLLKTNLKDLLYSQNLQSASILLTIKVFTVTRGRRHDYFLEYKTNNK